MAFDTLHTRLRGLWAERLAAANGQPNDLPAGAQVLSGITTT